MEASDTRLGSYAWKSILIGRDVIQRGSRWRVGNGEKINIWQHRWLPRKHPPQLPTCPIDDFEHSLASCLIDPNTRQWQTDIMDGLFVEADAEIIKKIPLSQLATMMCYIGLSRAMETIVVNRVTGSSKMKQSNWTQTGYHHLKTKTCGRPFGLCVCPRR